MIVVDRLSGLSEVYLGDNTISEVYVGDEKVWEKNGGEEDMNYIFQYTYTENGTEIITKECDNITTSISKGDLLKYIGKYYDGPYTYEKYVSEVKIGDCVTEVGMDAFLHFSKCKKIVYGKNVRTIERYQIWNSDNIELENITVLATIPPSLNVLSFTYAANTSYSGTIYVPSESVEAYKNANVWSNYANRIQPIP